VTAERVVGGRPAAGHLGLDTGEASVGQLMSEIATDLSTLVRQEVALAKAEVREEATKAGKAVGMLGGGAYAAHLAALVGTFACVFGLAHWMSLGWAALIMTVVWAVAAAVLVARGRAQLRAVHPKPERTVETLKEDAAWARHPIS
jgi:hypothetical protein